MIRTHLRHRHCAVDGRRVPARMALAHHPAVVSTVTGRSVGRDSRDAGGRP